MSSTPWGDPFWSAIDEGRIVLPWCADCDQPHFPPRRFCPHCWGERVEWRDSPGAGVVHSFTVVRAGAPTAVQPRLPLTIAIVELDEGVHLLANLVDGKVEPRIDSRVEFVVQEVGGRRLPAFRVAS